MRDGWNSGSVKVAINFEKLYGDIAPKLTNFLVAGGTDYSAACDIVQETFLRIWKHRDELVDDPAQISGFAYTIAKNLRNDGYRKAKREVLQGDIMDRDDDDDLSVPRSGNASDASSPSLPSDNEYLRKRLEAAFSQLPPLLREAYMLFQIYELPIREIARRTNQTESNVKVRIFRAKEKLKPLLKDLI